VLRPKQVPAIAHTVAKLRVFPHHGIFNAGCGIGKTTMSIYIACILGVPTLVIVPDSTLFDQWQARIKLYCPTATVGRFSGVKNKKRVHGAFCVASLTTLSLLDPADAADAAFLRHYRFVVVDECHKSLANTRRLSMNHVHGAFWVLGLSATLNRGDRCMHGIEYLVGPVVYRLTYLCCVDVQRVKYVDPGFRFVPQRWNKKECNFTATLSALVHNRRRTHCIARLVRYYRNRGRNVILLARQTQVLEDLHELLGPEESGLVCGTATSEAARVRRDVAKTRPVVLGSEQLAATGLDKEDADCLVLATPMKGGRPEDLRADPRTQGGGCTLQQAAGRLTREDPDKAWPVLVDFYDGGPGVGPVIHGLTATRLRWYRDNECELLPELVMGPADGADPQLEFPTAAALQRAQTAAAAAASSAASASAATTTSDAFEELFGRRR
jgi:superfamily II DNA or RNA helicase